jgi:hypothetical protein
MSKVASRIAYSNKKINRGFLNCPTQNSVSSICIAYNSFTIEVGENLSGIMFYLLISNRWTSEGKTPNFQAKIFPENTSKCPKV